MPVLIGQIHGDFKVTASLYHLNRPQISYGSLALTFLHEKNKEADQPVYPHRLISVFVIRLLESIISKLDSCKISIF